MPLGLAGLRKTSGSGDANDSLKKLEKEKTITEDEQKKAEAEVQKLTDKFVADADKRSQAKEKEIMDI